jgi:uncharacterized protein (TIGR03435 family)
MRKKRAHWKPPPQESDASFGGASFAISQNLEVLEALRIPEGTPRTRKTAEARRFFESPAMRQRMELAQWTGMAAMGSFMDQLRLALEDELHRPVVDETGLTGRYDFQVRGEARTTEEFLEMLRNQVRVERRARAAERRDHGAAAEGVTFRAPGGKYSMD